jgi:hypothetical protein
VEVIKPLSVCRIQLGHEFSDPNLGRTCLRLGHFIDHVAGGDSGTSCAGHHGRGRRCGR